MQTTHVKDSIALHPNRGKIMSNHMRASPSGKAVASQAAIREFESRRPLFMTPPVNHWRCLSFPFSPAPPPSFPDNHLDPPFQAHKIRATHQEQ